MKKLLTTLLFMLPLLLSAQTVVSWNIQYLGEAKFKKDTIVPEIARVMQESNADIICIQELVTNKYGDSCIIQIADILNYNYVISEKTTGRGTERYAYLYDTTVVMNYNYLDSNLAETINREPYIASFTYKCEELIIRQLHAVPASKDPETEIKQLYYKDGIVCGDFNLNDNDPVFNNMYEVYNSPLYGEPTSLKRDGSMNKSYDHFFISKNIKIKYARVFMYEYDYDRRKLSDHMPIIVYL